MVRDQARIKHAVTLRARFLHKFEENKASKSVIIPFFEEIMWRVKMKRDMISTVKRVRWLARYVIKSNKFQNFKLNYLKLHFQEQAAAYYQELSKSKKKSDKKMFQSMASLKWGIVGRLLKLYLEKCRFKHSLAFWQYRKMWGADIEECNKMFEDTKER